MYYCAGTAKRYDWITTNTVHYWGALRASDRLSSGYVHRGGHQMWLYKLK